MKNNIFTVTAFLLFCFNTFSQDIVYKDYDWSKEAKPHILPKSEKELGELIIKEKHAIEYLFDKEKNQFLQYALYHRILRVNSNKAIEQNNRIYIPSLGEAEYLKHKVRVISPMGKVKILSDTDIKEAEDEETKVKFRYYALEGIEIGSELEYFYIKKSYAQYTGVREIIQSDALKRNVEFEIISSRYLHFKIKSYNGLPEFKKDTIDEKSRWFLKLDTVQALKKESSSSYTANLQQFIYKLERNSSTGNKDIVSYGSVSENIYKSIMAPNKDVLKKVKKLVQSIDIRYSVDEEDKLRTIEHYLKTHFNILDNQNSQLEDLSQILDKKIANKEGMTKLFASVFNELKIDYQIVLTCERTELKFDPNFESYNFLKEYLIFLPTINNYLAPTEIISCLGFVPSDLTNNYGLFIKKVNLNNFETGIGKIKFINPVAYDKSYDNLKVVIDASTDIMKPAITLERQMGGYYAQYYQPYYSFYSEENKKKTTETIMKDFIEGIDVKNITVENEGLDFFGKKPFIIKSSFVADNLIEKAGNRYLFKVGELIGRQMEMYNEEKRKLPVESQFNRSYQRKISFEIPKGYKVSNLNALNMDVFGEKNGEKIFNFTSTHTVVKDKIEIDVVEYYKVITVPLDNFENYRKVVNAAADFNKITLFLDKE